MVRKSGFDKTDTFYIHIAISALHELNNMSTPLSWKLHFCLLCQCCVTCVRLTRMLCIPLVWNKFLVSGSGMWWQPLLSSHKHIHPMIETPVVAPLVITQHTHPCFNHRLSLVQRSSIPTRSYGIRMPCCAC